jgi:threonine synthase
LAGVIDAAVPAEQSIVLRYRNAFRFGQTDEDDVRIKDLLGQTSIREGARVVPLAEYKGVVIDLLDETSLMHTRSLKSIDGCFTTAQCKWRGYSGVVFESGGNTGTAFAFYGSQAGLETYFFVPEENLYLLSEEIGHLPGAHLIAVEKPGHVKRAAALFRRLNGLHHIPERSWRYEASRFRGLFILESMVSGGGYDWICQTISAAFGPIGIYHVLFRYAGLIDRMPRFLGVQQEANCPMYRAWQSRAVAPEAIPVESTAGLLSRVMYDAAPQTYGTYPDLEKVLRASRGELITVNHAEFARLRDARFAGCGVHELLRRQGVDVEYNGAGDPTGLIALAGLLKQIDAGEIPPGSRALWCLTAGARPPGAAPQPHRRIPAPGRRQARA